MEDSQKNNKEKSRDKDNYVCWTMEETNELIIFVLTLILLFILTYNHDHDHDIKNEERNG
jgi:hypothetical protein